MDAMSRELDANLGLWSPVVDRRIGLYRRSLANEVTAVDRNIRQVLANDVGRLCGSGHRRLYDTSVGQRQVFEPQPHVIGLVSAQRCQCPQDVCLAAQVVLAVTDEYEVTGGHGFGFFQFLVILILVLFGDAKRAAHGFH